MPLRLLSILGQLFVTLFAATVVLFTLLRVMPGDPAVVALGVNATPEALEQWRVTYGTDRPLVVQYLDWAGGLLRADFGESYVLQENISALVVDRTQVTLILVITAMALALIVAIPLGTLAAIRHRNVSGAVISGVSQVGVAVPNFLVGVLLIALFAVDFGWLPSGGWVAPGEDFVEFLRRLVLPALALGTVQAAVMTRYVRSAVLEIMREDFLRTARAKGMTSNLALVRHGLRNAGIPVLTVVGVQLATMLIGAVVIERVFAIPGLGSLLVDSVANRDLITVQGVGVVLVVLVVVINFLVEITYSLFDPRLRKAA